MNKKVEIREEILKRRKEVSGQKLREASQSILEKLITLSVWKEAKCVYAYMDTNHEIMTNKLIEYAWQQGKEVAVPKVRGLDMEFYVIHSFSECENGYFGILEPIEGLKKSKAENALIIVPGVAFDEKCNRIGYGKGFYDRFLMNHRECTTVGIAGEWQMVKEIPAEDTDISLDYLITNDKIIENKQAKKV